MKTVLHRSARRVTSFTGVLAVAACTLAAQSAATSREVWQRPDDIVAALGLTAGSQVADVGAGDGFFIVRLARAVGPSGRVLAVEIELKMLEALKQLAQKEKLPNVDVIQGEPNDPHLEANSLDAVLMVHAYHEMREHGAMLAHIRKALRPKGRLVIVEHVLERHRDEARDVQVKAHDLAPEYVVTELHAAGFRVERLDANFATDPADKNNNWIIVATPGNEPRR
jgi:FkbM family methyltransferase